MRIEKTLFTVILMFIMSLSSNVERVERYVSESMNQHEQMHGKRRQMQQTVTPVTWLPLRLGFLILPSVPLQDLSNINAALNVAKAFFASHFLVQRSQSLIQFSQTGYTYCFEFLISPAQAAIQFNADIVFFVSVDNSSLYLASAGPCAYDPIHQRPIFGEISFGPMFKATGSVSNVQFEHSVQTVIHEIIHGLGFLRNMYKWYYNSATNLNHPLTSFLYNNVTYLSTPRLKAYTQFYFGCSSAVGLPMENEGGSGTADSHMERSLFLNEIMTGSDITGDTIFSIFTFKLLEDSGWYRLGNIKPDVMDFGQFRGCGFLYFRCLGGTFNEYCNTGDTPTCSYSGTGFGSCLMDSLADKCGVVRIFSDFDCRDTTLQTNPVGWKIAMVSSNMMSFQYNSICYTGSLSSDPNNLYPNSCHIRTCSTDNKVMIVTINNINYSCMDGSQFSSSTIYGVISCPVSVQKQCFAFNECPNQCNQNGFCIGQRCICSIGYSGNGCQNTCSTYRYNSNCVTICPIGTFNEDSTLQCLGCPYGCGTCSNIGTCTSCITGFLLQYSFCERDLTVLLPSEQLLKSQRTIIEVPILNIGCKILQIFSSVVLWSAILQ